MDIEKLLADFDSLDKRIQENNKACEDCYRYFCKPVDKLIKGQLQAKHSQLRKSEIIDVNNRSINKLTLTDEILKQVIRNALSEELSNIQPVYKAKDELLEYLAKPKSIFSRIGLGKDKEEQLYFAALHEYKLIEMQIKDVKQKNAQIIKNMENPVINEHSTILQNWLHSFFSVYLNVDQYTDKEYDFTRYVSLYKEIEKKRSHQDDLIKLGKEIEHKILSSSSSLLASKVEEDYKSSAIERMKYNLNTRTLNVLKNEGIKTVEDIEKRGVFNLDSINGISANTTMLINKAMEILKNEITQSTKWELDSNNLNNLEKDILKDVGHLINIDNELYYSVKYENVSLDKVDKIDFLNTHSSQQQQIIDYCESKLEEYKDLRDDFVPEIDESADILDEFDKKSKLFLAKFERLRPGVLKKRTYDLPEEIFNKVNQYTVALDGLKVELPQYQLFAAKYIIMMARTIIGDQMGVGKTLEAISSAVALRNAGHRKFMVVCPAAVVENWVREVKKFSDLMPINHYKNPVSARKQWDKQGGVLITSYDKAAKMQTANIENGSLLIIDEAHYIKNPDAKRTQIAKWLIEQFDRVTLLTGTALENKVEEMIELVSRVNLRLSQVLTPAMPERFKNQVAEVYLRRRVFDVIEEMPDKQKIDIEMELQTNEERLDYKQRSEQDHPFMSMRQVSWIKDTVHSTKMSKLKELVEEFSDRRDKAIIFSFFKTPMDLVKKELEPNIKVFGKIDGSLPSNQRQAVIDEFTNYDGPAILLGQTSAAGTGLNIQAANIVIFLEPQIKPSLEEQAIARSWRRGQKRDVIAYRLICRNTIDERILMMLEQKQRDFLTYADQSKAGELSKSVEITPKDMDEIVRKERERIKDWNIEVDYDNFYYDNCYVKEFIDEATITKERALEDLKQTIYDDLETFNRIIDNPLVTAELRYYSVSDLNEYQSIPVTHEEVCSCYSEVIYGFYQTKENFAKEQRKKMNSSLAFRVKKRDGFKCVICGRGQRDGVTLEVDHIKPVSKGGLTEMDNLQTLCFDCNRGKSDDWNEEDWELYKQLRREEVNKENKKPD